MGSVLETESLDHLVDQSAVRPGMRLVIDFSAVHLLTTPALGHLIRLKKRLVAGRGRLGLRHLHADLVEVFRITRLDQVFDLEP
jgi:anti-sigma B factor antagonist